MASLSTKQLGAISSLHPFTDPQWKYDVFLSFRGEDVRNNFVSHLYKSLVQNGINTFKDDKKLERGKEISPELLRAIEESRFSIIVFSKNYATSGWCLDELVKIIDCTKLMGQTAVPIFYNVDPSDIRRQKGSFAEAFVKHENDFQENTEKVKSWRAALKEAASIAGYDSRNRQETEFIQVIVEDIFTKLDRRFIPIDEILVGIDAQVEEIFSLLRMGTDDTYFLGIFGLGGIGKTTIAKVVYNRISNQFDGSSYLANVREDPSERGILSFQKQLLSDILMEWELRINNTDEGCREIKKRLHNRRVLIVLDNVDQIDQLERLAGKDNWFGPGSRIIITTRNERLLVEHEVIKRYRVRVLDHDESLELFSQKAFKQNHPAKDHVELSYQAVDYAKGLPLALKVLGSSLYSRSINEWESTMCKLREIPNRKIMDVLMISFDGLDETEKDIFLDIAFFFKENDKDYVIKILGSSENFPEIGISVLAEKSLITISANRLCMHDLVQKMGWDIVHRESPEDPGKRSRLLHQKDVKNVLSKNKGTESVKGMIVDMPGPEKVHLGEALRKMNKLRLLKIYNVRFSGGLKYLSNELRSLEWHRYPLEHLPSSFQPDKLVELSLWSSHIKQLWKGTKVLNNLKSINLSFSESLTKVQGLTGVPNLKILHLSRCEKLSQVDPSIWVLKRLTYLDLTNCKNLKNFPRCIALESLEFLSLSGCLKLKKFPEVLGNMGCLSKLYLGGTAITELPSSVENLTGITTLELIDCNKLVSLPSNICKLTNLNSLYLNGCSKLEKMPSVLPLEKLGSLCLQGCKGISPQSWDSFFSTWSLPCTRQDSTELLLPSSPDRDSNLNNPGFLSLLQQLNLSGNSFEHLPAAIGQLPGLIELELVGCMKLKVLPELPSSIQHLDATDCSSLERLSKTSTIFKWGIVSLNFINCFKLVENQLGMTDILQLFTAQEPPSESGLYELVLPGNDIPGWFSHQSMGSSICIPLPLDWCNNKGKGLAFCALLGGKDAIPEHPSEFMFHLRLLSDDDDETIQFKDTNFLRLEQGHIWLGYRSGSWPGLDNSKWPNSYSKLDLEVSFYISHSGVEVENTGVYKCGVRLVYGDYDQESGDATASTCTLERSQDDCYPESKTLHLQTHYTSPSCQTNSLLLVLFCMAQFKVSTSSNHNVFLGWAAFLAFVLLEEMI